MGFSLWKHIEISVSHWYWCEQRLTMFALGSGITYPRVFTYLKKINNIQIIVSEYEIIG